MGLANQVVEAFHNASGGAIVRGAIFRAVSGVNQAALASAGALSTLAGTLGTANNGTGSGGLFSGVVAGEGPCLLVAGLTPVAGQKVYVSTTAGSGTTAAPALALPIGTIVDASRYSIDSTVIIDIDTALVITGGTDPLWDPSLVRYYFLDNENGNDNNVGYIDAAAGTVFAAGAGAAVALKTSEELRNRLPRIGGYRLAVAFFKPRSDAGNYVNKAGANDYLDIGYGNYKALIFRGSGDLTNSANDRVDLGGVVASAGPNSDSSWTASGAAVGFTITVSAGTLPAQDTLTGLKLQFQGNATAAARLTGNVVAARSSATDFDTGNSQTIANGDLFFFMRPGVKFTTIVGDPMNNGPDDATLVRGLVLAGFEFTSALSTGWHGNLTKQFIRYTGAASVRVYGGLGMSTVYRDETNTSINTRCGLDARSTFQIGGGGLAQNSSPSTLRLSAFHAATTFNSLGPVFNFGGGCYFLLAPSIFGHTSTPASDAVSLTLGDATTSFRPVKLVAGAIIKGADITLNRIDLAAATAGFVFQGEMWRALFIGVTGALAAGVSVIDMSGSVGGRLARGTGNTATAGAGGSEIVMANGVTATFASLSTSPQMDDTQNITFMDAAGVIPVVKKAILKFSGAHEGAVGAVTSYLADQGSLAAGALVLVINYPTPNCRIRNLAVKCSVNALAANLVVEIYKNNIATGVKCTIPAGDTSLFLDSTHEAQFDNAKILDLRCDSTGAGVATAFLSATCEMF